MPGSLVILTGAGVSAESGVATFRDADGLWDKYDWRDLATPEAFARDPAKVHEFYNLRRSQLPTVHPNPAHLALADLEKRWLAKGGEFLLVTQNVDDLHERAGSERVLHMHGALKQMCCAHCGASGPSLMELSTETLCAACGQEGGMRPDIVWFGEMPKGMNTIMDALEACTHFAAIGTSATVYPAAGFVQVAGRAGAHLTELNMEQTEMLSVFDLRLTGPAGETTPKWVETILA
jgi:NAD-dependent deacetylase